MNSCPNSASLASPDSAFTWLKMNAINPIKFLQRLDSRVNSAIGLSVYALAWWTSRLVLVFEGTEARHREYVIKRAAMFQQ
jgi:hypothetical protein